MCTKAAKQLKMLAFPPYYNNLHSTHKEEDEEKVRQCYMHLIKVSRYLAKSGNDVVKSLHEAALTHLSKEGMAVFLAMDTYYSITTKTPSLWKGKRPCKRRQRPHKRCGQVLLH